MPYIVLDPATAKAAPITTAGAPRTGLAQKTFLEFQTELRARLMGRTDITNPRLQGWVNEGYVDLVTSLELDTLVSSVAITLDVGQPLYLLPYNVFSLLTVAVIDAVNYIDGGRPLSKIDLGKYRMLPVESNEPMAFFRFNDMLVVYPTPSVSRVINIDFKIRPTPFTADANQSILDVEWDEAILKNAKMKALESLEEWENATFESDSIAKLIARKKDPLAAEDEHRIILSSVPRRRSELIRDSYTRYGDDDGLR
jgi:hypothetical protein